MMKEKQRIAKILARAGVCSRRDAERMVEAGRVTVNGETLKTPAFLASFADDIRVDGQKIAAPEETRLFLYHKPKGLVTTARDERGRPTVFDHLPPGLPRLISVGRLDLNTEGLLLLTNDGELARYLELPTTGWTRRYRVRVYGTPDPDIVEKLAAGIVYGGVRYGPITATIDHKKGSNTWLTLALKEGKNREIRNVMDALNLKVNRLIRISYGPFQLGKMNEGAIEEVRHKVLHEQLADFFAKQGRSACK